jgi:CxxC motif-containing protein (DUF1111 family)
VKEKFMSLAVRWGAVVIAAALGCSLAAQAGDKLAAERLSAGDFTLDRADERAYSEPASILTSRQKQEFMVGRNIFNRQWASVVSLNGDWGLGPTFIADRCSACHIHAGRGNPPASATEQLLSMLVRLSLPGQDEHGGPRPDPRYGDQFQNRSLDGKNVDLAYAGEPVPAEASLFLDWDEQVMQFSDGESVKLRKPRLRIESLNFGPLAADVMTSLRIASPIFGLGLLEAVPESTVLEIARKQQALGFNGRPNYVWDVSTRQMTFGRYGWKANVATLTHQVASAAIGDMGLASRWYPDQNCPPVQEVCARQLPGNVPELGGFEIDSLVLWLRGLAVPARRDVTDAEFRRGEQLFASAQCTVCHVPELKTATSFPALPQLANQTVRAYTDLLLHDMGEELADGRPDFKASGRDWRTQSLWGLGLSERASGGPALLHDGRARSVSEAILWHGGEALRSRETYRAMSKEERQALLKFVSSI